MKPFDLKHQFIYEHFTCICLDTYNLDKAYEYLHNANALIKPFYKYFKGTLLPNKIDTNPAIGVTFPFPILDLPHIPRPCGNANIHFICG